MALTSNNVILWIILLLINNHNAKPIYCLPSNSSCWPTSSEISDFSSKLNGQFVQSSDKDYGVYINMTQDLLYRNQYPSFIVICQNVNDIQQSVLFASSHHIQISIMSTGHSFSGRNTANNSLQIVLSKMRQYTINKNAENGKMRSITVESGLQWGTIFGLVAPNIVIGPDDPSVGPVGASLRGGHSPISPHYGLISDFVLEYFLVDSSANIVHIYNTSGVNQTIDDLFWALRGGGGSTFGVIVNITFLIHEPEAGSVFTALKCTYPFYKNSITKEGFIGDYVFNNLWKSIQTGQLNEEWGGYLLVYGDYLVIDVNFYGNASYAQSNAQILFHLADPYKVGGCGSFVTYNTFEEMEITQPSETNGIIYVEIWNNLIPKNNLTTQYTDTLIGFFNSTNVLTDHMGRSMYGVFQGGKVNSFDDDYSAVTPGFRHNQFEIMLIVMWSNPNMTNVGLQHAHEWEAKFKQFGYGKYSNEENYECGNPECDWKQEFWSYSHYDKLFKIKQIWDPNQVFWCNHCVGSDQ